MGTIFCVKGFRKDGPKGSEAFHIEPRWWPRQELFKDPRLIEVTDGGFLDYEARLSIAEAREIHEKYRHLADPKMVSEEFWSKMIKPQLEILDTVLYERPDEFSHVLMAFYEWSSGM
jgi:hypothetical protein